MSLTRNFRDNESYHLPLLLLISITSHFFFVLNGFGEIDATKIAVSVIDIINHGSNAAFSNFYFTDVIPLYILYLKWAMKLLNYNYSYLPIVMNYTNAVFGTLIVIPAFLLIKQLFRNSTVAFCTVLALIFAPSFYQSTIMGFPHLIAFFFLLLSLCFYLSGLDHDRKSRVYFFVFLSCTFLTIAFLFKSDYVLFAGTYIGLLFIRKIRDKGKIASAFLIVITSGILFILFRNLILGPTSGTTMSQEGMSKWYNYSLIIPTKPSYLIRQIKPVAYGAGIITSCMGIVLFFYYLLKRKFDVLTFIVFWCAVPIVFWLVMIGNNARHNMPTALPILAVIVVFFYEKAPKYVVVFTMILIMSNFFITSPSASILTPSGNLFKSNAMLKERMNIFKARAEEISNLKEDKIAVLGYFHNPHVILEIMRSGPSYKAVKIGREDYKIIIGDKEFVFIYFVAAPKDIREGINHILNKYHLQDYVFVSVTSNLKSLASDSIKIKTLDIIERSSL